MRKSIVVVGLVACFGVAMVGQPGNNTAPRHVEFYGFTQSVDSLGVIVGWDAPPPGGLRRFPLAGYDVAVLDAGTDSELTAATVPTETLTDTLWMAMPPLGDTVTMYASVVSVDSAGNMSPPSLSPQMTWVTTPLMPLAPGTVTIDTALGALVIDSIQLIMFANTPRAADGRWELTEGQWYKQGAVFYSGGVIVDCCCPALSAAIWQGDPAITGHPCDEVEAGT